MTTLAEKTLHQEIMLRLRLLPVVAFSVPNSVFLPARTDDERTLARRLIHQMKTAGMLTPGAPDLAVVSNSRTPREKPVIQHKVRHFAILVQTVIDLRRYSGHTALSLRLSVL